MQPDPKKYKVKTIDVLETVLIIHENLKNLKKAIMLEIKSHNLSKLS